MAEQTSQIEEDLVPDDVIPHRYLPPLRYRDLPEAPAWTKLVGPSVMLAGLALGSGEFIFWPYITYKAGFIFFWACMLGVFTQYFINMEIERWTLVTGESAITGFSRLSPHWAWLMMILNIVPWIWPGWATGAGTLICWLFIVPTEVPIEVRYPMPSSGTQVQYPEHLAQQIRLQKEPISAFIVWKGAMDTKQFDELQALSEDFAYRRSIRSLFRLARTSGGVRLETPWSAYFAIGSLLLIGVVLTTGPVIYNTVERLQVWLVTLIFVIAVILGALLIRPDAWWAMLNGVMKIGTFPSEQSSLSLMELLGAIAFAGAGGTMNLGQSNFIRDKGYGMGKYVGRITSPLTGQEETVADVGYHFRHTPENTRRFRDWWKAANYEHVFTFLTTCVVCLVLLALISYSLFYLPNGDLRPGMERYGKDMDFVWGEATLISQSFSQPWMGQLFRVLFIIMGASLLLTTELGVLDATTRISTDIVKVNYLRNNTYWTQSRLYFTFLWTMILISVGILVAGLIIPSLKQPMFLLKTSAAMNGGVMFLYSTILLYMNTKILPRSVAVSALRFVAMLWACAFFGYFTIMAMQNEVFPLIQKLIVSFD